MSKVKRCEDLLLSESEIIEIIGRNDYSSVCNKGFVYINTAKAIIKAQQDKIYRNSITNANGTNGLDRDKGER